MTKEIFWRQDGVRTVGLLTHEGAIGGHNPLLQVFEFGPLEPNRQPSDILPYLPIFRYLFAALPKSPADMMLKSRKVPLADLECVTSTMAKMGGPTWYLNIKKGILQNPQSGLSYHMEQC